MKTIANEYIQQSSQGDEIERIPEKMIIHEDFDHLTLNNDVCLLGFEKNPFPIEENDKIAVSCVAERGPVEPPNGERCWVAGWGAIGEGQGQSPILQELAVNIIDRKLCNSGSIYRKRFKYFFDCRCTLTNFAQVIHNSKIK